MSDTRQSGNARERTQLFANVRPYSPASAARPPPGDLANPYSGASTRAATPQFTDAMYDQLESQHDEQFSQLSSKITMLKDLTSRIGSEVKEGNGLLGKLEDRFDGARVTVRNTMGRMIRSADKSGVSWRSWLALFGIIILCFWFVTFI